MKSNQIKYIICINLLFATLYNLISAQSDSGCAVGCSKCQILQQNQPICQECYIGFQLVNNLCKYTLCSPYTFLQYDTKIVEQKPSQCKAICDSSFEENKELNLCQQIQSCSISYNSKQSINRSLNGGIVEGVFQLSRKVTMVVYPTYQALIDTQTGSYMQDIIDYNIITVNLVDNSLILSTVKNEMIFWNFISNEKTFIAKIEKGKLTKKTQLVVANSYFDYIVTSYDEGLNAIFFTAINFTGFPIVFENIPQLSTLNNIIKIIDKYVFTISQDQKLTVYVFNVDHDTKQFSLTKKVQSQTLINFVFPYQPIIDLISYINENDGSQNMLFIQEQSKNLVQLIDYDYYSDTTNTPIDLITIILQQQPDNLKYTEKNYFEEFSVISIKFGQKISFYYTNLEHQLDFEQPYLTDYAVYHDLNYQANQYKIFILYTSLSLVSTHIIDFSTSRITDKSRLLTQIQNPLKFLSQYQSNILGDFGIQTPLQNQGDISQRNLEFNSMKEFTLFVFSENLQKIDIYTDETSYVVNPFSQKKWMHSDAINQMAYSEEYFILLTCSEDGSIIAWSTFQNMNPVYLYKVRKSSESCRQIQIHNNKWVIAVFTKSIIIFHLRNQKINQEFQFLTNNVNQLISSAQNNILLYIDNQFILLDGDNLSQISLSSPFDNYSIQKIMFLDNLSFLIQNGDDQIQLFQFDQQLKFPSKFTYSYSSEYGNITFLKVVYNESTSKFEILVGFKQNTFIIFSDTLTQLLHHTMQEGYPFEVAQDPNNNNTYILYGLKQDQRIAYQYFHYILNRSNNQGLILGRGYSLKFNLGINEVNDYSGKTNINYLCTMPYSFFTLILRVIYHPENKSIGFGYYVFSFGKGITQYVNQDQGKVQYYAELNGSLSFDTNSWDTIQRLKLAQQNSLEPIKKLKSSAKLGVLFVVQNEVNIYNLHTNEFLSQIKFNDSFSIEQVKKIIISENLSRVYAYKDKQIKMRDYNSKEQDLEFTAIEHINGVLLDENLQKVYIYGSQLIVTNIDLVSQKIVLNGNQNYHLLYCLQSSTVFVCKTDNYQILIYNILSFDFINSFSAKTFSSNFKINVDGLYNQIFVTAQLMQIYDFQGNLISKFDGFTYEVMELSFFGTHIVVLTKSHIYVFKRETLVYVNNFKPNGGGNLLGYYYIEDYNLIAYYSDEIRYAQLYYFSLSTYTDDGYTSSTYTELGYGRVVFLFYDPQTKRLNYVDSYGYLYSISLSSQKAFYNLIPFDEFNQFGILTNYHIDYNFNNLYIYNENCALFINYNLVAKYVVQQNTKNQNFYFKLQSSQSQTDTTYFIFDKLNTLYTYKEFTQTYLAYYNSEIIDVKQLDQYQLLIFLFEDKLLIYTFTQALKNEIKFNNYVGIIETPKIERFLSDELYVSTDNKIIHINYMFYSQPNENWQFKIIQFPEDDQLRNSLRLDDKEEYILLSFKSGKVILYNQVQKEVIDIIPSGNSNYAKNFSFTPTLIVIGFSDGNIALVSRQDYKIQKMEDISQALNSSEKKICTLYSDSIDNRIYLSFCYSKLIYVLNLNSLEVINQISFPNNQYNRLQITDSYILACSWSQINIYRKDTLQYTNKIRKSNHEHRILQFIVIDQSKIILAMNSLLEVYLFTGENVLLIDQMEVQNPAIIDAYLSGQDQRILRIVGFSDNTILDKRINLKLFNIPQNTYNQESISTLTPAHYSCFQSIIMNDRLAGQNLFDIVYNKQNTDRSYRIAATYQNELKTIEYIPDTQIDIIISPSAVDLKKKFIGISSITFQEIQRTSIFIQDFTLFLARIDTKILYSPVTKYISWQDVRVENQDLVEVQMIFSAVNRVVISNLTISNITYNWHFKENQEHDTLNKWEETLFLFKDCDTVIIENLSLKNVSLWWRSQIFGFQNVKSVFINKVKITESTFYTIFRLEKGLSIIMSDMKIIQNKVIGRIPYSPQVDIDQDQSGQQIERYLISIVGYSSMQIKNIQMKNNTNILLLSYINSFKDLNQTVALYNDQLSIKDSYIEDTITSIQTTLPLQQQVTQSLISCQSSNILISNMNYSKNHGNIFISSAENLNLEDSNFQNNQSLDGGALYLQEIENVIIKNSQFQGNTAEGSGGAIYLISVQQLTIDEISFIKSNKAQIGGGIRLIKYGNESYSSKQIIQNEAKIFGDNIGIYPTKMRIKYNHNSEVIEDLVQDSQITTTKATNQNQIRILDFRSGDLLPVYIQFLDQENNILSFSVQKLRDQMYTLGVYSDIKSLEIEILANDIEKLLVVGQSFVNFNQFNEETNMFEIQTLKINSKPQTTQSIYINVVTNPYLKQNKISVQADISFRSCLIGEIQKSLTSIVIVCEECQSGQYSLKDPNQYISDNEVISCLKCPSSADKCEGSKIMLRDGYWRESNTTDQIFECDLRKEVISCKESDQFNREGCIEGFIGPLCEQCDEAQELWDKRYTFSKNVQSCISCNNTGLYYAYFFILTVVFIAYFFTSVCLFMNNFMFHSLSSYTRYLTLVPMSSSCMNDQSTFYMKSLINYIQLSSILLEPSFKSKVSSIISWPDHFGTPLTSVFSDSHCLYNERMVKTYGLTQIRILIEGVYPLFFLVVVSTIFYLMAKFKISGIKFYHNYATLTLLFTFFQPELIRFFTKALSCRKIGDKRYLAMNLLLSCHDNSYLVFSNFFIIPYIIILLVLPLFFLVKIYKNRSILFYCTNKYKFGYFYLDYKQKFYFWEFIRVYMKTFIVIFFTLYKEQDTHYCYQIITLFVCLYIIINYIFKPFLQKKVLLLETLSMGTLIVCILLQQLDLMYSSMTALFFLYSFHIFFVLSVVLVIIYFKLNKMNQGKLSCIRDLFYRYLPPRWFDLIFKKRQNQMKMFLRWKKVRKQILEITKMQAQKTVQICEASISNLQQIQVLKKKELDSLNGSPNNLNQIKKQKNSEIRLLHSIQYNALQELRNGKSSSFFYHSNNMVNFDQQGDSSIKNLDKVTISNNDTKVNTNANTNNHLNDEILCFTINDLENISQYEEHTMDYTIRNTNPPELKQLGQITLKNQ